MRLQLRPDLSDDLRARLEEVFLSMCNHVVRPHLVEEYLTPAERADILGHEEQTTTIVCTVANRLQTSVERTIVELARFSDLLGTIEYHRLCRAIDEHSVQLGVELPTIEKRRNDTKPFWERNEGKLWYRGEVLRQVKLCQFTTAAEAIFDAFENAGWPPAIPNPLHGSKRRANISQTLNYLNKGLHEISFHSRRNGAELTFRLNSK